MHRAQQDRHGPYPHLLRIETEYREVVSHGNIV